MPRRPKITFDYGYLSSLDAPDSIGELFFLTEPAQQVLSQLAEMVLWTNTRWENGTETEIEALAHRIYEELKVPLHLDDLIPLIDDVETLLRNLQTQGQCCPQNVTFGPGEQVENPSGFNPDDNPPVTWGDGETVVDLADYRRIWCGQARHWVAYLSGVGDNISSAIQTGGVTLDAVAGILAFGGALGLLVLLPYSIIAAVTTGILLVGAGVVWGNASQAIADNEDDIVCTILLNDAAALEAKIEEVVGAVAWNSLYQFFDYQSTLNSIATGVGPNGDTIPVRRADCPDCGLPETNPLAGPFIAVNIPDANLVLTPFVVGGASCNIEKTVEDGIVKALRFTGTGRNNTLNTFGVTIRFNPTWCTNLKGWSWRTRLITMTGQQVNAVHNLQGTTWYPSAPNPIPLDVNLARNVWTIGTPAQHNQMLNSYPDGVLNATGAMTDAQNWFWEKSGASDVSQQWVVEIDNFYALAGPDTTTCTERVL